MSDREPVREKLLQIGSAPDEASKKADYDEVAAMLPADRLEKTLVSLVEPYGDETINHDDPKVWVPIHAWRVLRRMGSAAGLEAMLAVADHLDDQLAYTEFPDSAAAAGPDAVPLLANILQGTSCSDTQRILAAKGLAALGVEHKQARAKAIDALRDQIAGDTDPEGDLNGFAAEGLMALDADCGPLIEQAYLAGKVQVGSLRAAALGRHFGFEA